MMTFERTDLPEVLIYRPKILGDERGFFLETFRADEFARAGITGPFVQDNHSGSRQGILRGLHYQIRQSQGKLVSAIAGEIYDVAVDIRRSSPTFGRWVSVVLSSENKLHVWVPIGFAHGFYVLSEWAEIVYKTTDYYASEWERTVQWNDPTLGIQWPLLNGRAPVLSEKDSRGKILAEADLFA
jgi:dTDP-4-dehydrorhamnose 3,5-epimerase